MILAIALVASVYILYALRVGTFQTDEETYVQLARYIAGHFPSALWQGGIYTRGIQRLDPTILALPFSLSRGPGAYEAAHMVQCVLFASTAIPVFLLARSSGLARPYCLLAATLSIVVPWAVVSTSFLSENLAYPLYAWSLYAVWLAASRPSRRHELFAMAAIVAAAFSRTALLALVPLLPLAILWQAWSWELAGIGRWQRVRLLPAQVWLRHRLVCLLAGAVAVAYLADALGVLPGRGLYALTGSYGQPHVEPLASLVARDRYYLARAAAGTGSVSLAIGLPWAVSQLVRPREGPRHALAAVCTLGVFCVLLSLLQATSDERYIIYATVPIALTFATGLADRTALGALAGAILVVMLIDSVTWPALANLYDFFTYPAAIFYQRVLLGHASLLHISFIHPAPDRLVEAAVVLIGLAWSLAARHGRVARPAAALLGVGVLAFNATQTLYALDKYVTGAGAGQEAAARSWIDRQVPRRARVAALAVSLGQTADYVAIWRTAEFWNTSIRANVFRDSPGAAPKPLGNDNMKLNVQVPSGLVSGLDGARLKRPTRIPRYLLIPRLDTVPVEFETEHISQDPVLLLDLARLREPARLAWQITGTSPEGFMYPRRSAEAIVYSDALIHGRRCATVSLIAPPGFVGRWRYAILSGQRPVKRGTLAARQTATISLPLSVELDGGGPLARMSIHVDGSVPYPNGSIVSARLSDFQARPCSAKLSSALS